MAKDDDGKVVPLKVVDIPVTQDLKKVTLRQLLEESLEVLEDGIGGGHVYSMVIMAQTSEGGYHNVPIYNTAYELLGMMEHHKSLVLQHYLE